MAGLCPGYWLWRFQQGQEVKAHFTDQDSHFQRIPDIDIPGQESYGQQTFVQPLLETQVMGWIFLTPLRCRYC